MNIIQAKLDDRSKANKYRILKQENGKLTCVCNYELIKVDENTWRCTGGSEEHIFLLDRGDIVLDKFGNPWARPPREAK